MKIVLERKDIEYLNKKGFFFFKQPYNDNDIIKNPFNFKEGKLVMNKSNIFTERNTVYIEDQMINGSTKCYNITNPETIFINGSLEVKFKEYNYSEVISILNREYNLEKVLIQ